MGGLFSAAFVLAFLLAISTANDRSMSDKAFTQLAERVGCKIEFQDRGFFKEDRPVLTCTEVPSAPAR